jgi:hypothetical protein
MLVNKFDFDKRKTHLSAQILIDLITKDYAKEILNKPAYDMDNFQYDSDYISRKLEISPDEFKKYLNYKGEDPKDFKSNDEIYFVLKKLQRIIEFLTRKKISNYS